MVSHLISAMISSYRQKTRPDLNGRKILFWNLNHRSELIQNNSPVTTAHFIHINTYEQKNEQLIFLKIMDGKDLKAHKNIRERLPLEKWVIKFIEEPLCDFDRFVKILQLSVSFFLLFQHTNDNRNQKKQPKIHKRFISLIWYKNYTKVLFSIYFYNISSNLSREPLFDQHSTVRPTSKITIK